MQYFEIMLLKLLFSTRALFTSSETVTMPVPVKVYHCANGDEPIDRQNGSGTQTLTGTGTVTVMASEGVNRA